MRPARVRPRLFAAFVLAASGFLLFADLGDLPLWQDEANAALLGRNILGHGVPQVFDGRNYAAYHASDVRDDHVWRLWGWAPLYVNAAVYALAGPNTAAARLPYAALGVLFLLVAYAALRRRHPDTWIPEVAVLLCLFSVPLLLHFRQCQYYAPVIVLGGTILYLSDEDLSRRRHAAALVLASLLLFNCNALAWGMSMLLCAGIQGARLLREGRLGAATPAAFAASGLVVVPTLLLYRSWELSGWYAGEEYAAAVEAGPRSWSGLFFGYVVDPVIPWPLLLALLAAYAALGRGALGRADRRRLLGALFFFAAYVAVVLYLTTGVFRYYLAAVPALYYAVAIAFEALRRRSRAAAVVLGVVLVATNVAGVRRNPNGRLVSWTLRFANELTTRNEDVNELLIEHLRAHAGPDDTLLVNYGAFPIVYYTGLAVGGGPSGWRLDHVPFPEQAPAIREPDWLVLRKAWSYNRREFDAILATGRYRRVELPGVDTRWGNRPSPGAHHFRTPRRGPPLEIFERIDRG